MRLHDCLDGVLPAHVWSEAWAWATSDDPRAEECRAHAARWEFVRRSPLYQKQAAAVREAPSEDRLLTLGFAWGLDVPLPDARRVLLQPDKLTGPALAAVCAGCFRQAGAKTWKADAAAFLGEELARRPAQRCLPGAALRLRQVVELPGDHFGLWLEATLTAPPECNRNVFEDFFATVRRAAPRAFRWERDFEARRVVLGLPPAAMTEQWPLAAEYAPNEIQALRRALMDSFGQELPGPDPWRPRERKNYCSLQAQLLALDVDAGRITREAAIQNATDVGLPGLDMGHYARTLGRAREHIASLEDAAKARLEAFSSLLAS